jgi:hypothetical protein
MMTRQFLAYLFGTGQIAGLFTDTNDAFGVSNIALRIDLEGGDGDIDLRFQD